MSPLNLNSRHFRELVRATFKLGRAMGYKSRNLNGMIRENQLQIAREKRQKKKDEAWSSSLKGG